MADSDTERDEGPGEGEKNAGRGDLPGDDSSRYDLAAALNHRMRRQMLRRLNGSELPLSPCRLAKDMGVSVTNLSYHMDILARCGAVEGVDEQQVRGTTEHFYRSRVADHPGVQTMLEESKADDEVQISR